MNAGDIEQHFCFWYIALNTGEIFDLSPDVTDPNKRMHPRKWAKELKQQTMDKEKLTGSRLF